MIGFDISSAVSLVVYMLQKYSQEQSEVLINASSTSVFNIQVPSSKPIYP